MKPIHVFPPAIANQNTTANSNAQTNTSTRKMPHRLVEVAQQRCHMASEKTVEDAREMGMTAMEA